MNRIDRKAILKEMQDMARHNVMCYSANYAMSEPKDGMREEWEQAIAKARMIDQMFDELPGHTRYDEVLKCWNYYRKYAGSISGWSVSVTNTSDPHPYVDTVEFDINGIGHGVADSDTRIFHIDHHLGIDYLNSGKYDVERHARYDEGKTADVRITVDSIGYIREIEWLDE